MTERIAFIGGGQMAGSLVGGLLAAGQPAASVRVAEPDAARAAALRREFGVEVQASAAGLGRDAALLVLAVKPQQARQALAGVQAGAATTLLSIAAGIRVASLRAWLGPGAPIVRSMPNTPALVRAGVTGLYAPPDTPAAARALAERVLGAVGATCWVPEEAQLDAVTAVSGSGPAYYFLLTEALRDAAVGLGLDPATARLLAERTFTGAARMADGERDVAQLRANVTSKGGTTEAALKRLEAGQFRRLLADAVADAARRGTELGDEFAAGAGR